jgi:hypothetical protein
MGDSTIYPSVAQMKKAIVSTLPSDDVEVYRLPAELEKLDADVDGKISPKEFEALSQSWNPAGKFTEWKRENVASAYLVLTERNRVMRDLLCELDQIQKTGSSSALESPAARKSYLETSIKKLSATGVKSEFLGQWTADLPGRNYSEAIDQLKVIRILMEQELNGGACKR